jgi:hypothetical protein
VCDRILTPFPKAAFLTLDRRLVGHGYQPLLPT